MNGKLLSLYGIKWDPFSPELPNEGLFPSPKLESFLWRVEHHHVREGGFVLVCGEPGSGKSVTLRLLAEKLATVREVVVGALEHPQSGLADFYRELGDIFGVALKPHNRWGGFKALRERWQAHIDATLVRPVLLIDEAQAMSPEVLDELRILASTRFDSRIILSVVLAGDSRLMEMLKSDELLPLCSRIRTRLVLEPAAPEELLNCLKHLLRAAGNAKLMTPELATTLCEHAMGNYRALTTMAGELLAAAARAERPQLDEKLYFELFGSAAARPGAARAGARTGRSR